MRRASRPACAAAAARDVGEQCREARRAAVVSPPLRRACCSSRSVSSRPPSSASSCGGASARRFEAGAQRQQVAREVAAVDRRDVRRAQRLQRLRVVPVVEVAAVALHARHRVERRAGALDQLAGGQVAEVVRRQVASSDRPMLVGEVRWAMRSAGCSWKLSGGRWLSAGPTKVSKNRQVRRASTAQLQRLGVADASTGAVRAAGSATRRRPATRPTAAAPAARRAALRAARPRAGATRGERQRRGDRHAPVRCREVAGGVAGCSRRRGEVCHSSSPAAGDMQAPQRAHDRVEAERRLVGQRRERDQPRA